MSKNPVHSLNVSSLNFYLAKIAGFNVKSIHLGDTNEHRLNRWYLHETGTVINIPDYSESSWYSALLDLVIDNKVCLDIMLSESGERMYEASVLKEDSENPGKGIWISVKANTQYKAIAKTLLTYHFGTEVDSV